LVDEDESSGDDDTGGGIYKTDKVFDRNNTNLSMMDRCLRGKRIMDVNGRKEPERVLYKVLVGIGLVNGGNAASRYHLAQSRRRGTTAHMKKERSRFWLRQYLYLVPCTKIHGTKKVGCLAHRVINLGSPPTKSRVENPSCWMSLIASQARRVQRNTEILGRGAQKSRKIPTPYMPRRPAYLLLTVTY
jgi:hypothetical protein